MEDIQKDIDGVKKSFENGEIEQDDKMTLIENHEDAMRNIQEM